MVTEVSAGLAGALRTMAARLREERVLYAELLQLAETKRALLSAADAEGLEAVVQAEMVVLGRLAAVEAERFALQTQLASELGLEPAELGVRRLASLADGAEREVLLAEWRALLDVMGRLQRVNDDNGRLLQRLVAYGRRILGVVGAADGGSAWVLDRRG